MKISKWYGVGGGLRIKPEPKAAVFEVVEGYKRLWTSVWFPYEAFRLQYVLASWILEESRRKREDLSKKIEKTLERLRDIRKDIEEVRSSNRPDKEYRLECLERGKRSYQEELDRLKARYTAYDVLEERLEKLLENIDTIARLEGWSE